MTPPEPRTAAPPRMTGIWEVESGPPLRDSDHSTEMLRILRHVTEAMPPDADIRGAAIQIGDYRWRFHRLSPLTLLEGPDGGYAVLAELEKQP
jgi:hypothetical protein